jgi:hypothetical protein
MSTFVPTSSSVAGNYAAAGSEVAANTGESVVDSVLVADNELVQPILNVESKSQTSTTTNEGPSVPPPFNPIVDRPSLRPHSTFVLPSFSKSNDFFRNIQLCGDGSSLLGVTEHASLEILNL